jgi:hypothetical protein
VHQVSARVRRFELEPMTSLEDAWDACVT